MTLEWFHVMPGCSLAAGIASVSAFCRLGETWDLPICPCMCIAIQAHTDRKQHINVRYHPFLKLYRIIF